MNWNELIQNWRVRFGRASGLPYYCAPLVCISAVIGLLAVWRHNKPKRASCVAAKQQKKIQKFKVQCGISKEQKRPEWLPGVLRAQSRRPNKDFRGFVTTYTKTNRWRFRPVPSDLYRPWSPWQTLSAQEHHPVKWKHRKAFDVACQHV